MVALLLLLLAFLLGGSAEAVSEPAIPDGPGSLVARVEGGETVELRDRPGGRVVARVGDRTEFGSPQALAVVREGDGGWLGVTSAALPNGAVGWIDPAAERVSLARATVSLEADLSRGTLLVREGERVLRTMQVGIGRPDSPTPTGRFAITDKLVGPHFGPYYGCCILALSGRQPNLPPGWQGGDRLAIHGGSGGGSRAPVSAGCLKASDPDLRWLMRRVPVGTQLVVHP